MRENEIILGGGLRFERCLGRGVYKPPGDCRSVLRPPAEENERCFRMGRGANTRAVGARTDGVTIFEQA